MRPYLKNNTNRRAGDMVQVVECLPSMCKTLGSSPVLKTNIPQRKQDSGK
jgi:hypothetical protein